MKIYIAAKYARRLDDDVRAFVQDLRNAGHEITAQWLDNGEAEKSIEEAAIMDVYDVRRAECLIFVGQPQASKNTGGGRWFEFGLAYERGMRTIAVLDTDPSLGGHDHLPVGHESVFTALPGVEVATSFGEALDMAGLAT